MRPQGVAALATLEEARAFCAGHRPIILAVENPRPGTWPELRRLATQLGVDMVIGAAGTERDLPGNTGGRAALGGQHDYGSWGCRISKVKYPFAWTPTRTTSHTTKRFGPSWGPGTIKGWSEALELRVPFSAVPWQTLAKSVPAAHWRNPMGGKYNEVGRGGLTTGCATHGITGKWEARKGAKPEWVYSNKHPLPAPFPEWVPLIHDPSAHGIVREITMEESWRLWGGHPAIWSTGQSAGLSGKELLAAITCECPLLRPSTCWSWPSNT
jgi:hypothetical protein